MLAALCAGPGDGGAGGNIAQHELACSTDHLT